MQSGPDPNDWSAFLDRFPQVHLLQTYAWGELKSNFGWSVERLVEEDCGAQVLFRRLPTGVTLGYVPKGPVGDWSPGIFPALRRLGRERGAFAIKLEPDLDEPWAHPDRDRVAGLQQSPHEIQPRRTLSVSLQDDEDELLARMHSKTRYNIRLAARKGITVRPWADAAGFGRMAQETASRNRFGVHVPEYYETAYRLFHPRSECELLVADYAGQPVAAVMVFARGRRAWYFYGASRSAERQRMPTYLLQWEAMRWARGRRCKTYDLWGVPDHSMEKLEREFTGRSDGLWGVYRFKRGFGGRLVRSAGAWDLPIQPAIYWAYRLAVRLGFG